MRRDMVRIFAPIAFAISLHAQTAPTIVPISKEEHHHLVLDNDYVRVYSVEVAPHSETLYHQHDLDYIFVTLGDSDVDSVRVGEQPVHLLLKDGEVRFTKGGFAHKAVNNSDKPFKNVTIELKRGASSPNKVFDRITGNLAQRTIIADSETRCNVFTMRSNGATTSKVPLLVVTNGPLSYTEGDEQKPQTAVVMQAGGIAWSERVGAH